MQYFLCDCWLQTCQTSCFYHQPGVLYAFWGHFSVIFLNLTLNAQKRKKSDDNIFHFVYVVLGCKFAKCHVFFLNGSIFSPTLSDYDERNNIILVEKYIIFSRAVMYLKRIFQGGIRPSTICHDVNHSFHLDASH